MCICLNRLITGAGALHRDEGDWGHSRIARAIRGMYDNKAYFSPLLVSSDLLRLCVSEKANVCCVARAKCLLTIIRTE